MKELKKLIKNPRIIILLVLLTLSIVSINPDPWQEGVAVRSVTRNSSAADAGIESPQPTESPRDREIILSINNRAISDEQDYYSFISTIKADQSLTVKTDRATYRLIARPKFNITVLNETEMILVNETVEVNETINGTVVIKNETKQRLREQNKVLTEVIGTEDIGLQIYNAPTTNLRKGLDLEGGSRIILEPELEPGEQISPDEMSILLANMKERINVYGLTDVVIREVKDLSGKTYVLVELAGSNEQESRDLISQQGKFEATIGNETVFRGGADIPYVCLTADCSGIDPQVGCNPQGSEWVCGFSFSISLSPEAARRHAEITDTLEVIQEGTSVHDQYLTQNLDLFLDDVLVNSLRIGASLKGRADVTQISISGAGFGITREEATFDALANMKQLQTILVTGSLPVKLNVVKMDAISSMLGKEFTKNAILVGLVAIVLVAFVVWLRYRRLSVSLPLMFTMVSEVVLMLGVASLIKWNLDLAAIAGIIIAAGTGVDDQIVIIDEALRGESAKRLASWKERIKNAFFIIMAAYFTTVVAMAPLLVAGAGLLKGFAFTTIIGVSFGVFVSRPAFAVVIETLLKEKEK